MRRIVIDPFDPQSVEKAITSVVLYREWVRERIKTLCERLAKDYALKTVAEDCGYSEGGEITCTAEETPNGWVVKAAGRGVFFLEYGTGPAAGTGAGDFPSPVSTHPGSYSDSVGAGTYAAWVDGGMQGPYPYTVQPRSGMYFAFRAANENVRKVAEEVFKS